MDDHQFAYRKGRNTDDALLFTLDTLYSHLEDSKSGKVSAHIMFFDFSSAFNTMQPHILANVLLGSDDVPHALVRWVLDYLTNRSQFVRIGRDVVSDIMECSTGAPQGTVLAPFLFTLYTSGIRSTDLSCPLIKFADDTALVGRIKNDDDRIYREQIANFVAECDRNYLHLNVSNSTHLFPKRFRWNLFPYIFYVIYPRVHVGYWLGLFHFQMPPRCLRSITRWWRRARECPLDSYLSRTSSGINNCDASNVDNEDEITMERNRCCVRHSYHVGSFKISAPVDMDQPSTYIAIEDSNLEVEPAVATYKTCRGASCQFFDQSVKEILKSSSSPSSQDHEEVDELQNIKKTRRAKLVHIL
ncbi:putative RNA-directed DNA polymerase from mobile element jockey-like [Apostichopus japonicus]|uniref:Putative RNA-directed DNA polymerase from mobile element jockey-like n=1 Tax=Stichopus japonicus TaxID=307972 RepID=A0A2G8KG80_STIJA|nr:putative RNA-directed DNA polymerase from mobile element jockey-like [Apostichopus japonicus]